MLQIQWLWLQIYANLVQERRQHFTSWYSVNFYFMTNTDFSNAIWKHWLECHSSSRVEYKALKWNLEKLSFATGLVSRLKFSTSGAIIHKKGKRLSKKSVMESQLQHTPNMIMQFFYDMQLDPSNEVWILMLHLQVRLCLPNVWKYPQHRLYMWR